MTVEFAIDKAISLTVTGVVTAFVAIALLIILTMLTRLCVRTLGERRVSGAASIVETPSDSPPGISEEASSAHGAELAAAIVTAVAVAAEEEEMAGKAAVMSPDVMIGAGGWKGYGRWKAFEARRLGRRRG